MPDQPLRRLLLPAALIASCLFGCSDFRLPSFEIESPEGKLPPRDLVPIYEGMGTTTASIWMSRDTLEGRLGKPQRERFGNFEYRAEGVLYIVNYGDFGNPIRISYSCDRFHVSGRKGKRPGVYFLAPRDNVLRAYGPGRLEGWTESYDSLGIGFGYDAQLRVMEVHVFEPETFLEDL